MNRYSDCIREDGECSVCSLSSYGIDCHGLSISKIAWFRYRAGLSQKSLAEKTGTNYRWVQKLENGESSPENITLKNALALADALSVDVRDLL